MKIDFNWSTRSLQLIFWNPFDADDREHIGVGYCRWPPFETRLEGESVLPGRWINFGFHAVILGPFEVRYWPEFKRPHYIHERQKP